MSILVNMLLEWLDDEGNNVIERVLWVDSLTDNVVLIEINNSKALPTWRKLSELENDCFNQKIRVLTFDPYQKLTPSEDEIPFSYKQRRDRAWEVIKPIVENPDGLAFIPEHRGKLINEIINNTGSSKKTIYHHLRRYWQGGQNKNVLLPLFEKCGAKGKQRQSSDRKRGRPSKLAKATNSTLGVNIDDEIKKKFERGINLFYENQQGRTLKDAFQLTLEKLFHQGYEMQNNVLVPILPPAHELPTFNQFRYWYQKDRNITREKISREGKRRFNLKYREITGNSTKMAFGPGSVYQIDATIGDIYLVSSLDRNRIIGRPVLYIVIDVFSRMIVGFSVSLEGPSWLGAMLALENVTTNKVEFCNQYGIEITPEDWPCHHLPESILADRGEFEGYNADNLVNALNIRVSNTPPYRADWKGIVERNFGLTNEKMIHWLPGAVRKQRERGDRDYRLEAVLDLHQFRQLMIYQILDHNHNHYLTSYSMDEFMIQDYLQPYPIDLWNWGIQNRVGHLRTQSEDVIHLNLLPSAQASITAQGIYYNGSYYTCELALREQWFVKARNEGRWKVKIAYDPRFVDHIYLRLRDSPALITCNLVEADLRFKGKDWYEVVEYFELQKQYQESSKTRLQQTQANFHAQVEQIVSEAQKQTSQAKIPQSKRSRIQGIIQNRHAEKEYERINNSGIEDNNVQELAEIIPIFNGTEKEENDYIAPPKPIDKLRQLRKKQWQDQDD
ncbi:Mu transposase C-terminal domain-containing protein [Geminocystis sp. NIES-3708]|uniref:Mu transposase C-terminal domain-containing protein n=1 Tax=Geminocystis sp. NIES-3708 TaxID=1615909 RepID=UPI000836117E|nr:Mu transposase C-terminal domain-containing protein [Geminocystis sp. NIES-3708]